MSTRRARIKAVASLPVRRKNAETQIKEEKPIKSPKTPRPVANLQDEIKLKSPVNKTASPVQAQEAKTVDVPKPTVLPPSPKHVSVRTPKGSEKVPVITPVPRPVTNTFASPLRWNSPARRALPSPIRNSPQSRLVITTEVSCERLQSPNTSKSIPDGTDKSKVEIPNVFDVQSTERRLDTPDDYNPPSIPESITDESGMDGIVPLQPTRNAPKPLDFLKSEIISDNAPVLFDPIVPLPSPSKVRPKLRPAPRLAPHRRNSIQGSASESEDESRRALLSGGPTPVPARQRHDSHTSHSTMYSLPNREVSRIRNDSVCSGVSQVTAPPPASPLKERHVTKCRRQEMSRRLAAMRRRRDPVKRDALTMYDLIFYNPTTNPIVPDQDELKAKEATLKDEEARKKAAVEVTEEDGDDPPAAAPVPQIKLGPNGEIMLDEQSLVIKQTESTRKLSGSVVREGAWGGWGGRYSRAARTADWSEPETVRFYRALAALGTDFTLMAPLFPDRTRKDLKLKVSAVWFRGARRYSRAARTADWSEPETVRFYRALAALGTDFTLMAPLFPDRTRKDLKLKVSAVWFRGARRYSRAARTADWSEPETVRFYRALAALGTDFTLMAPLFPDRTRKDLKLKVSAVWFRGARRYSRAARTADWSEPETVRFYRALAALGTDFTLMAPLFPDRTRKDLKLKVSAVWFRGARRYSRAARTADWSEPETVRFYRALAALGTDFTLMAPLFPDRTRKDLKLKVSAVWFRGARRYSRAARTADWSEPETVRFYRALAALGTDFTLMAPLFPDRTRKDLKLKVSAVWFRGARRYSRAARTADWSEPETVRFYRALAALGTDFTLMAPLFPDRTRKDLKLKVSAVWFRGARRYSRAARTADWSEPETVRFYRALAALGTDFTLMAPLFPDRTRKDLKLKVSAVWFRGARRYSRAARTADWSEPETVRFYRALAALGTDFTLMAPLFPDRTRKDLKLKVSAVWFRGARRYSRAARTADWSEPETVRFYRALAALGTDFTLMAPLFPDRTRKDLKLKVSAVWFRGARRYSRAARTADWSEPETVRFYRALAALGTDFTLMAPLFPDRTRKDLKLKVSAVWFRGARRYSRAARTADWSEPETVRFYRALAALGTDFTLMAPLFPDRTRKDLKLKVSAVWFRGARRYSRAARTADWSEPETVRFYRALAALGTDFTLMAPLFPDRTRKDLKLKVSAVWFRGARRYSRAARTADWSEPETVRFYRALAALGTDFTLMAPLFPDRTRKDLKLKVSAVWFRGARRYSRAARTADWSEPETVRFYRALAALGTDFTLMAPLFPDRTRKDLKLKFKKEEKLNGAQVDKALRSATAWDAAALQGEFAEERAAAARRARAERDSLAAARRAQRDRTRAAPNMRLRQSKGAKALEVETLPETMHSSTHEPTTADEFIQRALDEKPRRKRKQTAPKTKPDASLNTAEQQYATLTLINNHAAKPPGLTDVQPTRLDPKTNPQVPPNIEAGSLVVLTVNDPKSPTKKMLQTYISRGAGQLTPVALPPTLLNSVMGYMKTPRGNVSAGSSPQLLSPASVGSVDSRTTVVSATPSVIQVNPSPTKRQRHSSYTITQL